jgi:hypothetical protein
MRGVAHRFFRKEFVFAVLSAKAQAPMFVEDEAKLSAAVCAAVFQLGHETPADFDVDCTTPQTRATVCVWLTQWAQGFL